MRKRGLVHLHGLLDRVRIVMQSRGDLPDEALGPYRDLDVSPTAVYQPKHEHEQAVETLASILAMSIESDEQSPSVPPGSNQQLT